MHQGRSLPSTAVSGALLIVAMLLAGCPRVASAHQDSLAISTHEKVAENSSLRPRSGTAASQEQGHDEKMAKGEQANGGGGFFYHLMIWLGKFHPPMVNFPVGLLVAAAVAEFLLIVTKWPIFGPCTRYCIWFGAISAVAAAILGWFFSAIQSPSWLLTTHRWLGTSTAAWSLLLLGITELHYRRDRRNVRYAFRCALFVAACLVIATGFFGGAMVYGINHYAWPGSRQHEEQHEEEEPASAQERRPVVVTMTDDLRFEPRSVTVQQGQTILWKNTSRVPHTVTCDPELAQNAKDVRLPPGPQSFNSGVIGPGQTYSRTFAVAGDYGYFCIPHELLGMVGEVKVIPSTNPDARPGRAP